MCFTKPKTPQPGAQPAPPAAAGADTLVLGPTSNDDEQLRNQGLLGRLALRIGRATGVVGKGPVGTGGVGAGSGGGTSTSGGSSSSSSTPPPSNLGVGGSTSSGTFAGGGGGGAGGVKYQ